MCDYLLLLPLFMHCHLLKFIKVIYLSYCQFYQDSHHGKLYELKLNNFFIANII